jgi:glycoside/pentoside/hexuronide:cation symporter, GPH family
MSVSDAHRRALSLARIIAFSATSLPISAINISMSVYLPRHFASHVGLDLALVGAAFFIVRMIDIPVDGLLGLFMDKTKTPWGRYRAWTIAGAPVLMAGVCTMFFAPPSVGLVYLVIGLLAVYLGQSMLDLSHRAWAVTLAPAYNDRSRVFGVLTAVGLCGGASIIFIPVISEAIGVSDAANISIMGWWILALAPLSTAIVVFSTPERIAPTPPGHGAKLSDYAAVLSRPTFLRIALCDLALTFGTGWTSAIYIFYFTQSRGFSTGQASILLATYILAGVIGAPLNGKIATVFSKHKTVVGSIIGYAICLTLFPLIPEGNMIVGLAALFITGVFASGFNVLTKAMTADAADEIRLLQGQERSALLYAVTTMTNKISSAISVGITFWVLSQIGYDARDGATNTAQAIDGLQIVYVAGPLVFAALAVLCMVGYRLGPEQHAEIRRQLDERDARYAESVAEADVASAGAERPKPAL